MLGVNHIRTTAYNPRANGMIERSHATLKQLPIVLFGLHMRPDEDGSSAFSRVTGEQPLVPNIVPSSFDLTQLATELHKLPFPYKETRKKKSKEYFPELLKTCDFVWLRTDRVRKPLEAPYQGPFAVEKRTDDTMTLLIRGKLNIVSIDRCKPTVLTTVPKPVNSTNDNEQELEEKTKKEGEQNIRTRSNRNVQFKEDDNYFFY